MSEQIDISPSYRQLARTGAEIQRVIHGEKLERLASLCSEIGQFDARLVFGFEDGQVKVVGTVEGSVTMDCSRCNLPIVCECSLPIDVLVFDSEDRLQSWLDHRNDSVSKEVVVSGPSLDLIDLVEDELILGLPRAICSQCKSDNGDNYVYSAGPKVVKQSPFAGLSDLSLS